MWQCLQRDAEDHGRGRPRYPIREVADQTKTCGPFCPSRLGFDMKRENPEIEICPGITRRTVAHGETMYQMVATLAARSEMPAHSHPQEQIVHILDGRMRLIVE